MRAAAILEGRHLPWLLVSLCAAAACSDLASAPDDDENGSRSVLYVLENEATTEIRASDPNAPGLAIFVPRGTTVTALLYPYTLDELDLTPGAVAVHHGDPGRTIPTPARIRTLSNGVWRDREMLPASITELRLDVIDPIACAKRGGCFIDGSQEICSTPCKEEPEPAPPTLPSDLPAVPRAPPARICEHGWTATSSVVFFCAPPAPIARVLCPEGSAQFKGEDHCSPIGIRPCPESMAAWAASVPADALFVVGAAALGGDGTLQRPYSTLFEAITSHHERPLTIAIDGELSSGAALDGEVHLIGACLERAHISGATFDLVGRASFEDLRFDGATIRVGLGAETTFSHSAISADFFTTYGDVDATLDSVVFRGPLNSNGRLTIEHAVLAPTEAWILSGTATIANTNIDLGHVPASSSAITMNGAMTMDALEIFAVPEYVTAITSNPFSNVALQDVRIEASNSIGSQGIIVGASALRAERLAIIGLANPLAFFAATATTTDLAIVDPFLESTPVNVSAGSVWTADGLVFDVHGSSLIHAGKARISNAAFLSTRPMLNLADDCDLSISQATFTSRQLGTRDVLELGGRAHLEDLTIHGDANAHSAIRIQDRGSAVLDRVSIELPNENGTMIGVLGAAASATISGALLRNGARGIAAESGARVVARDLMIEGSTFIGINSSNCSRVTVENADLLDLRGERGLSTDVVSRLEASKVRVHNPGGYAVRILSSDEVCEHLEPSAKFDDLTIAGGANGFFLSAQSKVQGTRIAIEHVATGLIIGPHSTVEFEDLLNSKNETAAELNAGSKLTLDTFAIRDQSVTGLAIGVEGAMLSLHRGVFERNRSSIAQPHDTDLDFALLLDRVRFLDPILIESVDR